MCGSSGGERQLFWLGSEEEELEDRSGRGATFGTMGIWNEDN